MPADYELLGKHVVAGASFVSNLLLWTESGYFNLGSDRKPLLHLWSLGIEEQFYLVWPFVLVAIWKRQSIRIPALIVIALASFVVNISLVGSSQPSSFFLPVTRFWELALGSILAVIAADGESRNSLPPPVLAVIQKVGPILGLASILAASMLLSRDSVFPGWLALIPVFAALMILSGTSNAWPNKLLAWGILAYVGRISYPLYLWHWPLLSFLHTIEIEDLTQKRIWKVGALGASFILAVITYHAIELPCRRFAVRRVAASAAVGMLLVTSLGLAIWLLGGQLDRQPLDRQTFITNGEIHRMSPSAYALVKRIAKNHEEEKVAYRQAYRAGTCLVDMTTNDSGSFPPDCIANESAIALWGDSYAAHLAFGIRSAMSDASNKFSQLTTSGCVPLLEFDVPGPEASRTACRRINTEIAGFLAQRPAKVLLVAGNWMARANDPDFSMRLEETLNRAKAYASIVILIGPPVEFGTIQAQTAIRSSGSDFVVNPILDDLRMVDGQIKGIAKRVGVAYISPAEKFCKGSECLVMTDVCGSKRLMSWDIGHLTRDGSIHYVNELLLPSIEAMGVGSMPINSSNSCPHR
jgi:peptidoglycan/LPS O-acetylase OafA/YrhL